MMSNDPGGRAIGKQFPPADMGLCRPKKSPIALAALGRWCGGEKTTPTNKQFVACRMATLPAVLGQGRDGNRSFFIPVLPTF